MDLGYHEITLEKARRLGTGIVPPLSLTLKKQDVAQQSLQPESNTVDATKRVYLSVLDDNPF